MQEVAKCQYKVMPLDSRRAADMLYINGRLIHHVRAEMGDHSYGVGVCSSSSLLVCFSQTFMIVTYISLLSSGASLALWLRCLPWE